LAVDPSRQLGFLWGATALASMALAPLAPAFASALPPCPFHLVTGFPCASCGSTRAALALARLDVGGAFLVNPLAAISMAAFVLGGVLALALASAGHGIPEPRRMPVAVRLFLVALVAANWIYLIEAKR
jgi:hypothetical protein